MRARQHSTALLVLILMLIGSGYAQNQEPLFSDPMDVKTGLGFEYFSRTILWDDDAYTTTLKSYLFTLNADFAIEGGFTLTAILGYTLSNLDGLIFRQLPISVELGVGELGGFLVGAGLSRTLLESGNVEILGRGEFVLYYGLRKEWDIPGLNVEGTVSGRPTWMRGTVGPVFKYNGFEDFTPYLSVIFDKLWGSFKMDQDVQGLDRTENKKIKGQGDFSAAVGTVYDVTSSFRLLGELHLTPSSGTVDAGILVRIIYAF